MAQSNVVREPSMDEILASIRRIIESNDPVPPGLPTAMPEPEGFSGSAANDDMQDVPLTIDDDVTSPPEITRQPAREAWMQEPRQAIAELQPEGDHPAAAPQRSLSLADVAARVRAASDRNPGLRDLSPRPAAEGAQASPLVTGRMAAAGAPRPAESAPAAWSDMPPPARAAEPMPSAAVEPDDLEMQPEPEKVEAVTQPVSLISADAGHQVARSFQDLAVAVDQAERRSYDEIAADLLRPMLQEWLDENLPTLVERLVREEIERVARGNRR